MSMMKNIGVGIGIGVAVGGTAAYLKGAMGGKSMKKKAMKKADKAMKSVEGFIGDVRYMFK